MCIKPKRLDFNYLLGSIILLRSIFTFALLFSMKKEKKLSEASRDPILNKYAQKKYLKLI